MYGFFMLCEGFFQIRSDIPPWFIWVYYMGFHTYAFRAAVVNEFKDRGVMESAQNPAWGVSDICVNVCVCTVVCVCLVLYTYVNSFTSTRMLIIMF
jgi:hypothetical protein